MVQRSPTYFYPAPNRSDLADTMRALGVEEMTVHEVTRNKILHDQDVTCQRCEKEPEVMKAEFLAGVRFFLGDDYPADPISRRVTAPGSSAWPSSPTATCSRGLPPARRAW